MPLDLPLAARGSPRQEPPAPPPPPVGWFEGAGASFDTAVGDIPGEDAREQNSLYGSLVGPLTDLGHDSGDFLTGLDGTNGPVFNAAAIWQAVQAEKAKGHFKDLPATQAEFDAQAQQRRNAILERREATAARGPATARFAGGIAGAFLDPVNVATLPVGGVGKTAIMRVLTEGVAQAGIEAVELPLVQAQRRQAGRPELTGGEELASVGLAFGGGMVFRGLGETPAAAARAVEKNWKLLPQPLRDRWMAATLKGAAKDWDGVFARDPSLVADIAERIIGHENMTEAERGAVHGARTQAMHEAANPFAPTGAGAALHDDLMADTLARILADHPFVAGRAPGAPAGDVGPTAPVRLAEGGTESRFIEKTARAESGAAGDNARSATSSASGRFGFTDGTWLAYYKRRFGTGGLSDAAIVAKKRDGRLQTVLMQDLTEDNARFLRVLGEPVTEGNLYLTHFAGQGGARRIFEANPAARIENVVGESVVRANPFLRGKTAGWLIDWAHAKMGERAGPRGVAGVRFADSFGDDAERARLQQALDTAQGRAAEAAARSRAGLDATADETARAIAEGSDFEPVRVDGEDTLPEPLDAPIEARAEDAGIPAEVQALLPQLRTIADGPAATKGGHSLNDIDALANELGAASEDVRAALRQLVAEGHIVTRADTGAFMRKPPAPKRKGDLSLLEFIASRGGMEDRGGELAHMGAARWRREGPFRRKLIRPHGEGQASMLGAAGGRENSPEALFEAAISSGYFPEHLARLSQDSGIDMASLKPDLGEFYAAIRDELHGAPRFAVDSARPARAEAARFGEAIAAGDDRGPPPANGAPDRNREWTPEERLASFREAWSHYHEDAGAFPDDPEIAARAARFWTDDEAFVPAHAVAMVADEDYRQALSLLVDESMEKDYGVRHDIFHPDIVDEWTRRYREGLAGRASADEAGFDRPGGEPQGPSRREEGGQVPNRGGEGDEPPARLADVPAPERAPFADPDSDAAKAQANSLEHDARAAVDPAIADRQRQQAQLGAEAPMRARTEQDGEMGLGLFDAADQPEFSLEEGGPAKPLAQWLDELDADAAEIKTIRDCLE